MTCDKVTVTILVTHRSQRLWGRRKVPTFQRWKNLLTPVTAAVQSNLVKRNLSLPGRRKQGSHAVKLQDDLWR